MNKELFENVVRENQKRIYNYLLRFVRQNEDAEDLTQSVFLSFYDKIGDVEEEKALSYLYRAAHNQAINHLKKANRTSLAPEFMIDNLIAPKSEEYMYQEVVKKAIPKLPANLAAVLELQYYQGMHYKEIAERLDTTVKAVESKLVRAKKKLKKIIEKEIAELSVKRVKEL
jgi:RNA polymerase sigma-70 factor (ECF subfamily)